MANEFVRGALSEPKYPSPTPDTQPEYLHDRLISTPHKMALRVAKPASATLSPMSPTPPTGSDFGDTNAVMARVANVISSMIDGENQSNFDAYVRAASDWTTNAQIARSQGHTWDYPKPIAPFVVHMNFKKDADGRVIGWDEVTIGPDRVGPPVMDVAPLPPPPAAGTVVLGKNFFANWFGVGPGDSWPVDKVTPIQPDGHTYKKSGGIGTTAWYLQVS